MEENDEERRKGEKEDRIDDDLSVLWKGRKEKERKRKIRKRINEENAERR